MDSSSDTRAPVTIHIEDLAACIGAKGLNRKHKASLQGVSDLLQDLHASNESGGLVTLRPKNVEKVLGSEPLEEDEPAA